jgi:serine/threonine protein kinase
MTPVTAPDDAVLRQFLLGTLPPAEVAAVEAWLAANPDASVRLRSLSAHDTVTDAINGEANTAVRGSAVPLLPGGIPAAVGSYRVLRELGRGGMGVVLEAEDPHLKRQVAIKLIAPESSGSGQARERFLREAQAVARIDHPNVVPVHHVGEHDGQLYLVMPLLRGETLGSRLKREKKLKGSEVMRIGREVAAGLAAAHAVGLIHRDVKPANIWLDADTGRARVLDFGLAKPLDASSDDGLTETGAVIGTPHYMSPQQANGESLDERTDLFSLGAVLHHAATGVRPFDGPTQFAVLYAVVNDTPRNLEALKAALPARVAEVVQKLLEKKPDARPQSAAEVAERLTDAPTVVATPWEELTTEPDDETELLSTQPVDRPRSWARAAAGLVGGMLLAAAVVAATVVIIRDKNGKEVARIEVPDGGSVEVKPEPAKVPPALILPSDAPGTGRADRKAAEWVLSVGGSIRVDGAEKDISAAADLPKEPFRLTAVNLFNNAKVTDAGLAALAGCTELTELNLSTCRGVTDAGLAHFKGCTKLISLDVSATGVTDVGLATFATNGKLLRLTANATAITDAGLAALDKLTGVEFLYFNDTGLTDAGLKRLAAFKRLSVLQIDGTAVTDAGLVALAENAALSAVDVRKTKVTANGTAGLAKALPQCRIAWDGGVTEPAVSPDRRAAEYVLSVGGRVSVRTTKSGLQHITTAAELPKEPFQLETADFTNNANVTDAGLTAFLGCRHLKNLTLSGTAVTDSGLAVFKGCGTVHRLDLSRTRIGDAGLAHFKGCELRIVDLADTKVTDENIRWLAASKQLLTLNLTDTNVSDACAEILKDTQSLTIVSVGKTRMTPKGVTALAKALPNCLINWDGKSIESDRTPPRLGACGVIGHGGTVQLNDQPTVYKKLSELPREAFRITGVDLSGRMIEDSTLTSVTTGWDDVMRLNLRDTKVRDDGLKTLLQCTKLTALDVRETRVTTAGVAALAKALPGCRIEWDEGVIEPAINLDRKAAEYVLSIGGTVCINGTDDKGISSPRDLPATAFRLTFVNLARNPKVDDAGLNIFKGCTNLAGLILENTTVGDEGFANFKDCKQLNYLLLSETRLTDASLELLKGRTSITVLTLGGTKVTDAGMAHLKDCTGLQYFGLNDVKVTDTGLAHLKGCTNLTDLGLYNLKITDAGLAHFRGCKRLTYLSVYNTGVTDEGLAPFRECKELRTLLVRDTKATAQGVKAFAQARPNCRIEWDDGVIEPKK